MSLPNHTERYFYLLKLARFKKGFQMLNRQATMKLVKKQFTDHIIAKCKVDKEYARSTHSQNYIGTVLLISYGLKIFVWSCIILNSSYIIGMCWLIMCNFVDDFINMISHVDTKSLSEEDPMRVLREESFIPAYGMDQMELWEQTIIVTYYMFTSMSTVGFGDFHPKSDFERLVCTFILIFGVAIFSMIMGNFIAIIETFRHFNDDLDEGEELVRFFSVLRKFNHDEPVPDSFRRRLEKYFDYRWREDRNQGVTQGQDLNMYM